jgi:hypothetical protein
VNVLVYEGDSALTPRERFLGPRWQTLVDQKLSSDTELMEMLAELYQPNQRLCEHPFVTSQGTAHGRSSGPFGPAR